LGPCGVLYLGCTARRGWTIKSKRKFERCTC
jgi:hypothetical protein